MQDSSKIGANGQSAQATLRNRRRCLTCARCNSGRHSSSDLLHQNQRHHHQREDASRFGAYLARDGKNRMRHEPSSSLPWCPVSTDDRLYYKYSSDSMPMSYLPSPSRQRGPPPRSPGSCGGDVTSGGSRRHNQREHIQSAPMDQPSASGSSSNNQPQQFYWPSSHQSMRPHQNSGSSIASTTAQARHIHRPDGQMSASTIASANARARPLKSPATSAGSQQQHHQERTGSGQPLSHLGLPASQQQQSISMGQLINLQATSSFEPRPATSTTASPSPTTHTIDKCNDGAIDLHEDPNDKQACGIGAEVVIESSQSIENQDTGCQSVKIDIEHGPETARDAGTDS